MKQVLITGANRGIGLEHVRYLASRGVNVFAAVRKPQEAIELKALQGSLPGIIKIFEYDAIEPHSAYALKEVIGSTAVDLLLANAGVFGDDKTLDEIDVEVFLNQVKVNALSPLMLVKAFLDNIEKSERKLIAFQSSIMGSIALNKEGGFYSYRNSKAMLNSMVKNLSIDLLPRKISVMALHPGWVKTRMGGQNAPVNIIDSVASQQKIFANFNQANSGCFINYDGQHLSW